VRVYLNDTAINVLFAPGSDVDDVMQATVGPALVARMRSLAPVSDDGSHGRPPGYLRDSITQESVHNGREPGVAVGPTATTPDGFPYPLAVEFGTPPHQIRSHGPWPLRDDTGRVLGPKVNHPGTAPNPFIRRTLEVGRLF
jgi:hypothetical protein